MFIIEETIQRNMMNSISISISQVYLSDRFIRLIFQFYNSFILFDSTLQLSYSDPFLICSYLKLADFSNAFE